MVLDPIYKNINFDIGELGVTVARYVTQTEHSEGQLKLHNLGQLQLPISYKLNFVYTTELTLSVSAHVKNIF